MLRKFVKIGEGRKNKWSYVIRERRTEKLK